MLLAYQRRLVRKWSPFCSSHANGSVKSTVTKNVIQ